MDKPAGIGRLAADLAAAAAVGDWAGVAAADAAIAVTLADLPTGAADSAALLALRDAHAGALRQCAQAGTAAAAQLVTMQDNREGWIAYALENNSDLDGTPA